MTLASARKRAQRAWISRRRGQAKPTRSKPEFRDNEVKRSWRAAGLNLAAVGR